MVIIDSINKFLNSVGAELVRFPNNEKKRRIALLKHLNIDLVLDVGANVGKFCIELRKIGYKGEMISFEPLSKTFLILNSNSKKFIDWKCLNIALGNFNGESEINIAGNIDSSSILEMLDSHLESAPNSKYIGKEKIVIKTLDSIYSSLCENKNVFLKIDTQGFEKQVLDGSQEALRLIKVIQLEMSIIPLYNNSLTYLEMISYLNERNFHLHSIEPGFYNSSNGKLLQFDGVFVQKNKI